MKLEITYKRLLERLKKLEEKEYQNKYYKEKTLPKRGGYKISLKEHRLLKRASEIVSNFNTHTLESNKEEKKYYWKLTIKEFKKLMRLLNEDKRKTRHLLEVQTPEVNAPEKEQKVDMSQEGLCAGEVQEGRLEDIG